LSHTDNLPSPKAFRLWTAIATIGASVERRCYTEIRGMSALYPNMFVLLVGQPGVGKSVALNAASHFLRMTGEVHIAPATMTKAAMVDTLKDSKKRIHSAATGDVEYHSLFIPATEFGNLVPAYDLPMISALNDLFDCRSDFVERTRGGGEVRINNPQITLLGATQPDYLSVILPEAAWGMGFTSRIVMIYSDDKSAQRRSLFAFRKAPTAEHDRLTAELTAIAKMRGEFRWDPAAAQALDEWHMAGELPVPNSPRLTHYCTRRTIHMVKLMMIAALARHSLVITSDDFETAVDWLFTAEETMPEIFRAMVTGGDSALLQDTAIWVREREVATKGPIPQHMVIGFLRNRMKAGDVMRAFDLMVASQMIRQTSMDEKGQPAFTADPEVTKSRLRPPKGPDLFRPSPPPSADPIKARYILRVTTPEDDQEDLYDQEFYETHA